MLLYCYWYYYGITISVKALLRCETGREAGRRRAGGWQRACRARPNAPPLAPGTAALPDTSACACIWAARPVLQARLGVLSLCEVKLAIELF